ncbi:hypothetical protein L9F63_021353 [Diploptera punctata]|uniref:Uncharacterized protein n=1 Tax=Diploptera punctata TaxID=6984 RepID=A0AAD7ZP21_DIPPU|nr:hypothetical protein L9F63_021353 [Diploptera punctata]
MRQAVIVNLLVEYFGVSQVVPTGEERVIYEQIKKQLTEEDEVIAEVTTLLIDEEATNKESDSTVAVSDEETSPVVDFQGSSSSSYQPSPPRKTKMTFPEGYLADAYKIWMKQPREKNGNVDPPHLCRPGLAIDMTPHLKFTTVLAQKRKIKSKTVLQNFENTLKQCHSSNPKILQDMINKEVHDFFVLKKQENVIIHDRTLRLWALKIKKRIDTHNSLQFKASKLVGKEI